MVVYGPKELGGLEFFHLYDLQGYGQIECFLKYWRTPRSQSGQILRIVMSWIQYCAGVGWSVVQKTDAKLPHLESSWITSMREYLNLMGASLELQDARLPQLQREHDSYIMDHVLDNAKFQPAQIKAINWCRMYLGVVTVSDIANAAGTHIQSAMYHGDLDSIPTHNSWLKVHQREPNQSSWQQWRRACRLIASPRDKLLHQRLGHWIVKAAQTRHHWPTWKVPNQNRLYVQQPTGSFNSHARLHHDFDEDPLEQNVGLPHDAVPVDATRMPHTWKVKQNFCRWALPPEPPLPSHDLTVYIANLPAWEIDLLSGLELLLPQEDFLQELVRARVLVGTDGSVQGHRASFGWVMSTQEGNRIARCNGPAYGAKPVSYRAEGYGLLSALRLMHHLAAHWQTTNKFSLVCDNETMVNRANESQSVLQATPNSTMDPEWDVLAEIWVTRDALGDHAIEWVKGHQDDKKPHADLDLKAQLNVDADKLAESYITDNPTQQHSHVVMLPTSGDQLNPPQGTITHNVKKEISLARHAGPLRRHLRGKFDWSEEVFDDISWESFRLAMRRLEKHKVTLNKHVNGYTPVGRRVNRYHPKYPKQCLSCQAEEETAHHLLTCPAREQWRKDLITGLHRHFQKASNETPWDVQELLLEGTKMVIEGRDPDSIAHSDAVADIRLAQEAIGWTEVFRGRFSTTWKRHQDEFLGDSATRKNSGQTWLTRIAKFFLEQWLALWKQRNGDRHGHDRMTRQAADKRKAVTDLELLYQYKDQIGPHLNWIMSTPLDQMKQKRTYVLRAWISNFGPVIKQSHEYQTRLETG